MALPTWASRRDSARAELLSLHPWSHSHRRNDSAARELRCNTSTRQWPGWVWAFCLASESKGSRSSVNSTARFARRCKWSVVPGRIFSIKGSSSCRTRFLRYTSDWLLESSLQCHWWILANASMSDRRRSSIGRTTLPSTRAMPRMDHGSVLLMAWSMNVSAWSSAWWPVRMAEAWWASHTSSNHAIRAFLASPWNPILPSANCEGSSASTSKAHPWVWAQDVTNFRSPALSSPRMPWSTWATTRGWPKP